MLFRALFADGSALVTGPVVSISTMRRMAPYRMLSRS